MANNITDEAKIVNCGSMKDFHKGDIQNNHAFFIYLRHQILLSLFSISIFAHNQR